MPLRTAPALLKRFVPMLILAVLAGCCSLQTQTDVNSLNNGGDRVIYENMTKYAGNSVMTADTAWESSVIGETSILYDSGVFKMWYRGNSGFASALGYASSSDGRTWTKHPGNPFITGAYFPFVLKIGGVFYLFAVKTDDRLYRWSGTNGIDWTADNGGNPIMVHDAGLSWENAYICNVAVIHEPGTIYPWKMLYEAGGTGFQIGYAYSTNGLHWIKYAGNPVLGKIPGTWKSVFTGNPELLKINNAYYAIYGGHDGTGWKIGWSWSTNLIDWTDGTNNPILSHTQAWENNELADPSVAYNVTGKPFTTYLIYGGGQNAQGLATLSNISLENYFLNNAN